MWRPGGAPYTLGVWSPVGVAALGKVDDMLMTRGGAVTAAVRTAMW